MMQEISKMGKEANGCIDYNFLDESVKFINEKANETLYKGSLEIGDYLLKHFFSDDIELASSKNPRKPNSYKALCRHEDLAVPYSTLTIMVRVAAQERFFRANNLNTDKLSYTHKADLIRLENSSQKLKLAQRCMNENLSTRQFAKLVNNSRKTILEEKKSQQEETAFQNILKVEQLLNRTAKSELVTDINKLRNMRSRTRNDLRNKVSELMEQMAQKSKECRTLLKKIDKIENE